jgi:hypothetical protein
MSIKEFELFHGAVLTRLVRSDRPITVTLIETRPEDTWSVYKIIDSQLFIKHSTSPRPLTREIGGYSWTFTFSPDHINQISDLRKEHPTCVALVCGISNIKQGRMEICFINHDEIPEILELDNPDTQSVTVRYNKGAKKFRVLLNRKEKLLIYLNAIDRWNIPGS